MNQISDPAREYTFGTAFNYAQWTPDTVVTLANVPWNNDYRDIVRFANTAALNSYIDSMATQNVRIPKMSHVKPSTGVIRVGTPFNLVMEYNYLRASNPIQPIPSDKQRDYYYFILDVRYINPSTTEIVIQLDIWQSFGREVTFGSAFVERGHIGVANTKQFDNLGRDYLTVPEGQELGSDYRVIAKRRNQVSNVYSSLDAVNGQPVRNILVTSNIDLMATDFGTIDDPKSPVPGGGIMQAQQNGAGIYVWETASKFRQWLSAMKDYSWIVQGIMSITVIPTLRRWEPNFQYGPDFMPAKPSGGIYYPIRNRMFTEWRNSGEILNQIPERYRHFKKWFTFPYMAIEMTTWSANPVVLRPELWADRSAHVLEKVSFVEPNQRMTFHPQWYNANVVNGPVEDAFPAIRAIDPNGTFYAGVDGDDGGDYLDIQTSISNFPKLSILSSAGTAALAANAHSMHQARESADWSQERVARSAQVANSQANTGIDAANDQTRIATDSARTQQGIANRTRATQAALGAVGGTAQGAGMGAFAGPAGAVAGGVGGAVSGALSGIGAIVDIGAADESVTAANASKGSSREVAANQESFVANSNYALSKWASRGDYAQTIAAIDAKVQDLKLLPASVSGQVGGDSMNFIHDNVENVLRWKLVDNATIRRIGEYWLRYGYAVHARIKLPATAMVMTKFTYWKVQELYLGQSRMPESFKQTIRGMFEKGVTVWASPTDLANPDFDFANNQPLGGISY